MDVHYRWLRMMVALTVTEMEACHGKPQSGTPVLMILDEFAALRRMRVIENAAAQIAGSHVRMIFVLQSLAQAKEIYRDNYETLVASAAFKVFFTNDDHFTRDYASKLIGERESVRAVQSFGISAGDSKSRSDSYNAGTSASSSRGFSINNGQATQSWGHSATTSYATTQGTTRGSSTSRNWGEAETVHKRPLVTPDEIGRLFGDRDNPQMLVLVSGCQPVIVRRRAYCEMAGMRGKYDWHRDHPRPETRASLESRRASAARDAERLRESEVLAHRSRERTQRSYAAWELAQQWKVRKQWEQHQALQRQAAWEKEKRAIQAYNRGTWWLAATCFLLFCFLVRWLA